MNFDEEQVAVEHSIDRLAERFPTVARDRIAALVHQAHDEFAGRPVRDFIPVLVEHLVRDRLNADENAPATLIGVEPTDHG
ncbi:hypothetical protein [Diaminobutyricimonas sp. TR449]|uniref:three-helix bundle dimerization domain-containing protein n=1 Tax=Diaminobutyricimonas sp. TR449 TaxID=2708076 RepID=UPI00141F00D2|nr:hypothetical protein [Diaminobutyricimonas sp. TR449]